MSFYQIRHFLLQSLKRPFVINEKFFHDLFFCETFLKQKNQICFFTAFQSIEYFLINEWWCNYFHFCLFNKTSVRCVRSIQNKHALKSRPQDPVNVTKFFLFRLLVLFATVNLFLFSTLESRPILQGFLFSCLRQHSELTTNRL